MIKKMIKKIYGLEICAFMAPSRGATSGLSLSACFVNQRTLFTLHNNDLSIKRSTSVDSSLKVVSGNLTFNQLT